MHVSTAIDIGERIKKALGILERENTPEEYKKAIKDLRKLAKECAIDYVEKPISKKAWDNMWADVIGDFITTFDANAVEDEEEADERHEWFLRGMAKGMWTIYNIIEELMVREN
jgi:hypothetical protein